MINVNGKMLAIGTTLIVLAITVVIVYLPVETFHAGSTPSEIHRRLTELEARGMDIYLSNGCVYCHSQYIRTIDWGLGAERLAQPGDYLDQYPPMLGSIRTGPDLSQEGGEHTDDWHAAHFYNPRFTRPESLMPRFGFLNETETRGLIAFVQSLGGTMADKRVERQLYWRQQVIAAYEAGPDANIRWLHSHVPLGWREVPSPYPATEVALKRGASVYQRFCLGCHGPVGDGQGPASEFIYPPPLNFTTLRRHPDASGGLLYYQIMNGVTGSAMPYFKRELESEKIWDVGNYVALNFIANLDANTEPRGIDAAYEPFELPVTPPSEQPIERPGVPPPLRPGGILPGGGTGRRPATPEEAGRVEIGAGAGRPESPGTGAALPRVALPAQR